MSESEIIETAECWFRNATEVIETCDKNDKNRLKDGYMWRAFAGMYLALFGNGDCDSVINDYKKVIELDPLNSYAYYECGMAYSLKGDDVNGDEYCKKAKELEDLKKNQKS